VDENKKIRVAIFEDNPVIMDAYRPIIDGSPGCICTGSFTSCNNWKQDIQKSNPDVVLMDIGMTGITGIEATGLIKKTFPHVKILIQTVFDDDDKILEAICAGSNGYILKKDSYLKMLEAITEIQNGGVVFTPSVAKKVTVLFQKFIAPFTTITDYHLTDREKEILDRLTKGMAMPQIAESLFLSYHTIRDHVKSIYQKLHVASATQAVAKALREKLV
jgi:DNA-binding NarL/FixJ family response regulator